MVFPDRAFGAANALGVHRGTQKVQSREKLQCRLQAWRAKRGMRTLAGEKTEGVPG